MINHVLVVPIHLIQMNCPLWVKVMGEFQSKLGESMFEYLGRVFTNFEQYWRLLGKRGGGGFVQILQHGLTLPFCCSKYLPFVSKHTNYTQCCCILLWPNYAESIFGNSHRKHLHQLRLSKMSNALSQNEENNQNKKADYQRKSYWI